MALLRKLRALPEVKKVFIRSGIRFDYLLADKDDTFSAGTVPVPCERPAEGGSGTCVRRGAATDGKAGQSGVSGSLSTEYKEMNEKLGKKQYLVPYLMSSHPGSTLKEAVELAEYLRDLGYMPEQVQDFYPTPSTISTCMYYTGLDPQDHGDRSMCRGIPMRRRCSGR